MQQRRAAEGGGDLPQKKISTWVTAVSKARLRRQPTPMRGRADSRQTTLSTVVTNSDGSSPFNLKPEHRVLNVFKISEKLQHKPCFKQEAAKEGGASRPLCL